MLLARDPRLPVVHSAFGQVQFIQVVGVTAEEVTAAQAWNGSAILKLLKETPMYVFHFLIVILMIVVCCRCGGELLVTDMRRGESLFEARPEARQLVDEGVAIEGSMLSGVSAVCGWEHNGLIATPTLEQELVESVSLQTVHLQFNMEALQLWPLAIRLANTSSLPLVFYCLLHVIGVDWIMDATSLSVASKVMLPSP